MTQSTLRKASFGLGCFWGGEAAFGVATGVVRTKVGYTGGTSKNPTYYNIGDHTETVELQYDPAQTNYKNLLHTFWESHEPLVKHKRQYMSAIFYHDEEQKAAADELVRVQSAKSARPVQTVIQPAEAFYDAEHYHQKYALRRHSKLLSALNLNDKDIIDAPIAARLNGFLNGYGSLAQFEREVGGMNLKESLVEYLRHAIPNSVRHC